MKPVTSDNFGLLIAYLLPGFVALWGIRPFVPEVGLLLDAPAGAGPTVGGFLYGTLGSTAAGLVVSAIRWAVVDQAYHRTGIPAPAWDFRKLSANLAAFESHVQDHYRYYQFYANMLVAVALVYGLHLATGTRDFARGVWPDVGVVVLLAVLMLGSRDALRKYYHRTGALLAARTPGRPTRPRRRARPPLPTGR